MVKPMGIGLWSILVLGISHVTALPVPEDSDELEMLLPASSIPAPVEDATTIENLTGTTTTEKSTAHPPFMAALKITEDSVKTLLLNLLVTLTVKNKENVDTLIPALEAVLEKMSKLLNEGWETMEDFRHQKLLIDRELGKIEGLMFRNQGLREAYVKTQENFREQLQAMHDALDRVRADHLSLASTTTEVEETTTMDSPVSEQSEENY